MFQHILVPIDGSPRAETALPVAARLARTTGGTVILVRVVSTALEYWPVGSTMVSMAQTVVEADLAEAERYLSELSVSPLLKDVQVKTVVLSGTAAPTILSVARSYHADLIVLCSHGYTGMKRWVMGSVAGKIVRHSTLPVFVLREDSPLPLHTHPDLTQPLRALVTLDGSAYAKAALYPAARLISVLAAPAQGTLHLLRVVKASHPTETQRSEYAHTLHKAQTYLTSTVDHLREGLTSPDVAHLNLPITWSVAVDTDVAEAILKAAENGEGLEGSGAPGHSDVIVMATHGHSDVQHWAMGSITERVMNATRLPLLIVRPPEVVNTHHHSNDIAQEAVI